MNIGPNQEAWLSALESGEYQQCDGTLHNRYTDFDFGTEKETHCCLGVAHKLLTEPDGRYDWLIETSQAYHRYLSRNLALTETGKEQCVTMNDEEKLNFKQIAFRIRQNPHFFFREPK